MTIREVRDILNKIPEGFGFLDNDLTCIGMANGTYATFNVIGLQVLGDPTPLDVVLVLDTGKICNL